MGHRRWRVLRQDDSGNVFVASVPLSLAEARSLAASFEARAHKQLYSVEEFDDAQTIPLGTRV